MYPGEFMPHANDKMRSGYRQKTNAFGMYLKHDKSLERVMRSVAVRTAGYFRRNARRGPGPGPHNADMVRIEKTTYGGRKGDRMAMNVVAYGPNAAMEEFGGKANDGKPREGQHDLRQALIFVSDGRTISRGGKAS